MDSLNLELDLKKKGEIFEDNKGQLIFICCICGATNLGLQEVETHLKTHIDLVIREQYDYRGQEHLDEKLNSNSNNIWVKEEPQDNFLIELNENNKVKNQNTPDDSRLSKLKTDSKVTVTKSGWKSRRNSERPDRHIRLPKFEQYKCDICSRVFSSKGLMKCHIVVVHTRNKPYECEICGHTFPNKSKFQDHLNRHNNIKRFKCDDCEKAFVTSGELTTHTRVHRGERDFTCTICGKGFTTGRVCSAHVRRVHVTERRHKCDFIGCSRSYFKLTELNVHKRCHTGERPFHCDTCSKTFANPKVLRNHILIHKPDKQYQCKYCPSKYSQASGRRSHEKRVHRAS